MQDNTLLRAALGLSLLGILALYFLQQILLPPLETGGEWGAQDSGKLVRTQGIVEKSWTKNNQTYLTLNQSCLITAVLPEEKDLLIGSRIEITGKYNEYGNRKEIQADKIMRVE
ncbi:MAG TPA: hypothetical protein VJG90_04075 [Candidatus Nanoarchaeia archaeon]|nr:hypothetical protein [Candidatus Nanoarchaeia archaeon]